jgi:hypothetical protein
MFFFLQEAQFLLWEVGYEYLLQRMAKPAFFQVVNERQIKKTAPIFYRKGAR